MYYARAEKYLKIKRKRQPRFHRVDFMASTAKYDKKDALVSAVMLLFKKILPVVHPSLDGRSLEEISRRE